MGNAPSAFTQAALVPTEINYEGQMALTGYAFGDGSALRVDEPSATAGDFLWAELA